MLYALPAWPAWVRKRPFVGVVLVLCAAFYLVVGSWQPLASENPTVRENSSRSGGDEAAKDFNYPHPAESLRDFTTFQYFDGSKIYKTEGAVASDPTKTDLAFLSSARTAALQHLAPKHPKVTFANGRYRWLSDGVEYDLLFSDKQSKMNQRVTLFQKLEEIRVVRTHKSNQTTVVNIVMALRGRLSKYAAFLDNLVQNVVPYDQYLSLTVVYFDDGQQEAAQRLTASHLDPHKNFRYSFLNVDQKDFSRGHGLHLGAQHSVKNNMGEVLFFCDVDVLMQPDFFTRCRSNSRLGHQVYFPVLFSLYNPQLVYSLLDKPAPPLEKQLQVGQNMGFWRHFGFGMSCMYSDDYLKSSGFPDLHTWGGEDVAIYKYFLSAPHIKIIRGPEPALFHMYHLKNCSDPNSPAYVDCLKSKAMTEGSQMEQGLMLLKLQHGINLEGILNNRYKYFWLVPHLALLLVTSLFTNLLQAFIICTRRTEALRT